MSYRNAQYEQLQVALRRVGHALAVHGSPLLSEILEAAFASSPRAAAMPATPANVTRNNDNQEKKENNTIPCVE